MRFLISFYDEIFPREKRFRDMEILLYYCPHLKRGGWKKDAGTGLMEALACKYYFMLERNKNIARMNFEKDLN